MFVQMQKWILPSYQKLIPTEINHVIGKRKQDLKMKQSDRI